MFKKNKNLDKIKFNFKKNKLANLMHLISNRSLKVSFLRNNGCIYEETKDQKLYAVWSVLHSLIFNNVNLNRNPDIKK